MAEIFTRSPRRKQVLIALHPAEAKAALIQLVDEFTDAELDQLTEAIMAEGERRKDNEPK